MVLKNPYFIFTTFYRTVYKQQVLKSLHDGVGHPERNRTNSLVCERCYCFILSYQLTLVILWIMSKMSYERAVDLVHPWSVLSQATH